MREGRLPCDRVEVRVADLYPRSLRPPCRAAESPSYVRHEFEQRLAHRLAVIRVFVESVLARHRFFLARLPVHLVVRNPERHVDEIVRDKRIAAPESLQVAACRDAVGLKRFDSLLPRAPEDAYRLVAQERRDLVLLERHERKAVRLVLLGTDLREKAVWRDADRACHAAYSAYLRPERLAERLRLRARARVLFSVEMERASYVEKRLVYRDSLDIRRVV